MKLLHLAYNSCRTCLSLQLSFSVHPNYVKDSEWYFLRFYYPTSLHYFSSLHLSLADILHISLFII